MAGTISLPFPEVGVPTSNLLVSLLQPCFPSGRACAAPQAGAVAWELLGSLNGDDWLCWECRACLGLCWQQSERFLYHF